MTDSEPKTFTFDEIVDSLKESGWLPPHEVVNTVIASVGIAVRDKLGLLITPQEALDATMAAMTHQHGTPCISCQHPEFMHDAQYGCIVLLDTLRPDIGLHKACSCPAHL